MSTKNLSRTVIEGGRGRYNRYERRHSNAVHRAAWRAVSSRLVTPEDFDAVAYPRRKVVRPDFDDKLGPAQRWLGSQVGRPWSKVRSELFARFDTRTTAGRHIVYGHLLTSVNRGGPPTFGRVTFTVDRHGILRRDPPWRFRWDRPEPLPEPECALSAWLGARRVGDRGARLYWFVPTELGFFRQHRELTEEEAARWRALPGWFRRQFDGLVRPDVQVST